MNSTDFKLIRSTFKDSLGPSWPLFLAKSGMYGNTVFKQTHWASTRGEESKLVKRMAIAPAAYIKLTDRLGKEKAYEVMGQLLTAVSVADMQGFVDTGGSGDKTEMERLLAFIEAYETEGGTRFMPKEVLEQDEDTCHFVFTRCVVWDFMQEAGTPELTRFFCESDDKFFAEAFPELQFTRGDSPENTLAFGNNRCEYLFKKK